MRFLAQGFFAVIMLFILAIYIAQVPVADTVTGASSKTLPTMSLLNPPL